LILCNGADARLSEVLAMGCWTPVERFGEGEWQARSLSADGSAFDVFWHEVFQGCLRWSQIGLHNVHNALAAIAAARHAGVAPAESVRALANFQGVRRRMELRGIAAGVAVYDDFAHHPTAMASTLAGLRARLCGGRIIAVFEPRSNSMRMGVFKEDIAGALKQADRAILYHVPELGWDLASVAVALGERGEICHSIEAIVAAVCAYARTGDQVVVMSNGAFGGIHERLLQSLRSLGGT
jgi:UDP-N-acetylmuramate: L-alanyl-gamma-D-glutamyl-meso-diaminopimelate ligase